MNKIKKAFLFLTAGLVLTSCSMESVEIGHVGLKVNLYGSDRGLQREELEPGRYFCTINEDIVQFPVFEQNYVYSKSSEEGNANDESISYQANDGTVVNADIGISFSIVRDSADRIYKTYRKPINQIITGPLRNSIRDNFIKSASGFTVEEIYSNKKNYIKDTLVLRAVKSEFDKIGIIISKISYTTPIRLPQSIQRTIESKTNATQKAIQVENELREVEAQAKKTLIESEADAKKILIKAQAEAEANKLKQISLNPLLIQQQAIEKWDGKMPQVINGAGQMPFIQIQK